MELLLKGFAKLTAVCVSCATLTRPKAKTAVKLGLPVFPGDVVVRVRMVMATLRG